MPKKFLNSAQSVVPDMVEGMLLTDASLGRIGSFQALVRRSHLAEDYPFVKIISGGGAGHEPAHAGFIGDGMLSAAILGNVFASPSVAAVLATLRTCRSSKGILLVVKNYTGDRINFGLAVEQARAEGISVRMLVVDDDCALAKDKGVTGGRGIAGTVLIHKVAAATAAEGASLEEVYAAASEAVSRVGSMGVALTVCTVPGAQRSPRLDGDVMEVGLGIHGEQGREQREFPIENNAALVADIMVEAVMSRGVVNPGDRAALLLNNLGNTPAMEVYVVAREVMRRLAADGVAVERAYVGPFMTALDMAGVSLSLLRLSDDLLRKLDAPTNAPHWVTSTPLKSADFSARIIPYDDPGMVVSGGGSCALAVKVVEAVCRRIIELEPKLTEMDAVCGDGDCGLVMRAGALRVLDDLSSGKYSSAIENSVVADMATFCSLLAESVSCSMGGTSGGLLELMLRAMASNLRQDPSIVLALSKGVNAIQHYGRAERGMRTMLDAFIPAIEALQAGRGVDAAADAATEGALLTAEMQSLAGRSNYLSADKIKGVPDPGAFAVAEAFNAAAKVLKTSST